MRTALRLTLAVLVVVLFLAGSLVAALFVRQSLEAREIAQEWRADGVPSQRDLGSTKTQRLVPLVEAAVDHPALLAERGVAYIIVTDEATILMDLGLNARGTDPSPLHHNMQALGVRPDGLDAIVITHNHPDHVGSQQWWLRSTFSMGARHTDLGSLPIYVPEPLTYPGAHPLVAGEPIKIAEGVATTGVIPFAEAVPANLATTRRVEQSLLVNVEGQGIILITGCGHPGLERMLARTAALCPQPVVGVIGGLHLMDATPAQLEPTVRLLRSLDLHVLALSPHDSMSGPIETFRTAFPAVFQSLAVGREVVVASAGQ
mgnify:CR=1 FL=1